MNKTKKQKIDYYSVDMYQRTLEMINELWRLTKSKKLKWKRNELGVYYTKYKGLKVSMYFINYHRMDEQSSDSSEIELKIEITAFKPSKVLITNHSIGTEAFSTLCKIKNCGYKKSWRKSQKRFVKQQTAMLDYLNQLS